ncbi:plasmid replication protein RepC [Leisingera sp. McT4-56]|uniref:plasmid replication protein RepC n=1 Tax=Leisingera sp. McT4-56 TaxID=2881255 RepID=UPI001CF8D3B4|nr:plasmid replication protein RepC [Leisingera sp. McT4-56]MCB4457041.1 replication initiator RepC [Leisingera sp. McT4-56]
MEQASQIAFGRQDLCGRLAGAHDKWDLLAALTHAAAEFELSHRTLGVLKALLTFYPERALPADPDSAIVFPSNRKLMERLNGMPESTLRRHLAALTRLGIVSRKNSPNRKRYARRVGEDTGVAFGFDLSPLARHAAQIFGAAFDAKEHAERLAVLRDRVAVLRQELLEIADETAETLLEAARKLLRRKPCETELSAMADLLRAEIASRTPEETPQVSPLETREMSAPGSQNERHIQDSVKKDSDSEAAQAETPCPQPQNSDANPGKAENANDLATVLRACPEVQTYYPGALRSWQDADRIAETLSPMMGIEMPVLSDARAAMGRKDAATAVMCMLEKLSTIRSPGAYLRRLAQKARAGQFSTAPMLNALLQTGPRAEIAS